MSIMGTCLTPRIFCGVVLLGVLGPRGEIMAADAETPADQTSQQTLQEIVVTAEKTQERAQDVPMALTAVSAQDLTTNNQTRIQDYYMDVPGLTFSPGVFSTQLVAIRGITTGNAASATATVGFTVDDIPFGSSTWIFVPDIDPGELARVEVLRGPQGTLYGASSMGGLIKFVTIDPSTRGVSGNIEAGTDTVQNGPSIGYSLRGAVNLPLGDHLALRASGFTREDPGYIDDPTLDHRGVNEEHAAGGRVSALWKPSDALSVKLNAIYQDIRANGTGDVTNNRGILQQNYVEGVGPYDRNAQSYGVVVNYRTGPVTLTSVTGYNIDSYYDSFDETSVFGQVLTLPYFGVTGTPSYNHQRTSKVSQELRLHAQLGPHFEALIGGFYTSEATPGYQRILATDPLTGAVAGLWLNGPFRTDYDEYAAFADVTYHFTNRFDLQMGVRASEIRQKFNEVGYGPFVTVVLGAESSPLIVPEEHGRASPVTYLFTPRFKISEDLMVYARLASGYRAGQPNGAAPGIPPSSQSDKTEDYELGIKGETPGHLASFDASAYYIDWKDIQIALTQAATSLTYTGNAGSASSQGIELSGEIAPTTGLRLDGWVTVSDAKLTTAFPPAAVSAGTYGASGDQLPYNARFSGHVAVDDEFPIRGDVDGFAGAEVSYVGYRYGAFTDSPARQYLPGYAKVDLRTGVRDQSLTWSLYANNVLNRRGLISGGLGEAIPYSFYYIQPRTIGLTVSKAF